MEKPSMNTVYQQKDSKTTYRCCKVSVFCGRFKQSSTMHYEHNALRVQCTTSTMYYEYIVLQVQCTNRETAARR